ncbi:MAG: serine/threonine protein kinase [Mariniblastus sp.]|jgi:serine/threonine protein kinase
MADTENQLQEIFLAAVELESESERNQYLDRSCYELPLLRTQVDRLLKSHLVAGRFLEESPEMSTSDTGESFSDATLPPISGHQPDFEISSKLPRRFGDYELLKKIAHGGMGVVYKARHLGLNRIVAIKMILSGQFAGQAEIKRFQVEAEAAGNLDHAGIVPVFDVGQVHGQHFFSMAYIEGLSLAERIKESALPVRDSALIAKKIAVAIQVAHDQGIVHRDLKPGNVLLDGRNEPRITDFGLAKRVEGDSDLTTTGMVLGTPSYMPPEQAAGKEIDAAADIYSVGAILFAMLTGRPPFEGQSQVETIMQVLNVEPVSPRQIDKKIPKDLAVICLKCLEKKASDRYDSADDLAADLQRFLAGEPVLAKNDWKRAIRKWIVREPVFAAHLFATMVLIAIIIISFWIWGGSGVDRARHFHILQGNVAILGLWALTVFLLQRMQNAFQSVYLIPSVWSMVNPIFLTIALCGNYEKEFPEQLSWLVSIYFILISTSCFFRRIELVLITTASSFACFLYLISRFFETSIENCPSYLFVFGVNMLVVGVLLGLFTRRMKRLTEQNIL